MPGEPIEPRPLGPSRARREPLGPVPVPAVLRAEWVEIGAIEVPETFTLRPVYGAAPLAEAIARDGLREPLLLRRLPTGGLQLVAGHRRLEALRLLRRGRVLARIHPAIDEAEALYLALSDTLDREPLSAPARLLLRQRLEEEGRLESRVLALFERAERVALERVAEAGALAEEPEVEEVELEDLAARTRDQLADSCNDLAAIHESWADLDEGRREDLLDCVRYLAEMVPLLSDDEDNE